MITPGSERVKILEDRFCSIGNSLLIVTLNNCVSNSVIQVEEVSVQFTMDKKEMEERHTLVQKMVGIISIITIMI